MMHLVVLIVAAILCSAPPLDAVTGKTFFKPRDITQDLVLQHAYTRNKIDNMQTACGFTINANVFYEESTNSGDLARYFSIDNKRELLVRGLDAPDQAQKDISAEWLDIASNSDPLDPYPGRDPGALPPVLYNFGSTIKLEPEYKQFGATILLYKNFLKHFYISVYFPFTQVETNLKLQEYNQQNERIPVAGVVFDHLYTIHNTHEAFNNPLMKYGKMSNQWQKLAGLADIKAQVGFKTGRNWYFVNVYADAILPTGYKSKAQYVFEPMIGNGRHLGLGCGLDVDFKILKKMKFINTFEYQYLFESSEKRSFDLQSNGQWSRYMGAHNNIITDRPIPLINYLTKDLEITPRSSFNWLTALNFSVNTFNIEIGYNLYVRAQEKAHLKNGWDERVAIALMGDDLVLVNGNVAPDDSSKTIHSNINDGSAAPVPFDDTTVIKASNLNISSAQHPSLCTNKFYATVGSAFTWKNVLGTAQAGAAYENASSNKALSMWQCWGGVSLNV